MKVLFPYLGRWQAPNRSRYHQLIRQICLLGHKVHVLEAPPAAINDLSFTHADKGGAPGRLEGLSLTELHAAPLARAFLRMSFPRAKLLKKGIMSLSSMDQILRFVDRERIDVLLTYNLPQFPLLSRVNCHTHFDLADDLVAMLNHEGSILSYGGVAAAQKAQTALIHRADTVTVASHDLAEHVDRDVETLPNGADLDLLDRADGRKWRSKGLWPTVGFVGAFEYWVDFPLVLEVARRLPKVCFLLVGGGRRWKQVRLAIEKRRLSNVYLTGPMPQEQAMDYVAAMDVCLIPFKKNSVSHGACPLKLFEYAGSRKPIVSTRTREVGRLGKGWVAFADDAPESADAIDRFLSDSKAAARAGADGRAFVERSHDWKDLAQKFVEILGQDLALDVQEANAVKKLGTSALSAHS